MKFVLDQTTYVFLKVPLSVLMRILWNVTGSGEIRPKQEEEAC